MARPLLSKKGMLSIGIIAFLAVYPILAFFVLDRATRFPRAAAGAPTLRIVRIRIPAVAASNLYLRLSDTAHLVLEPPRSLRVSLN